MDDGIYITNWLGGNANMTTGDFSFGFQGHLIENGRKGASITEMNVTGNYAEILDRAPEDSEVYRAAYKHVGGAP